MNKNARELIQKMAGVPKGLTALVDHSKPQGGTNEYAYQRDKAQRGGNFAGRAAAKATTEENPVNRNSFLHGVLGGTDAKIKARDALTKKSASMKNIIDDIIKGAEQNTFGRPVSIQTNTEWTHFDTAKTAGALQALGEQGYSVKQAAEYLGLTEAQVQDILATVK